MSYLGYYIGSHHAILSLDSLANEGFILCEKMSNESIKDILDVFDIRRDVAAYYTNTDTRNNPISLYLYFR